ncbi:hypothetical protein NL388_31120, partial [Klebsiella pneumoniae]|nr:hypothetical protein [Klebsiella pneumoniae]
TGVNFLTPRPGKTRQFFGGGGVPYIYRGVWAAIFCRFPDLARRLLCFGPAGASVTAGQRDPLSRGTEKMIECTISEAVRENLPMLESWLA